VERVQAGFLLAVIANSLAVIPVIATAQGPTLLRLAAAVGLAVLVWVWVRATQRRRFVLAGDVTAGLILLVLGLAVEDPLRASAIVYVGLFFRALFGSGRAVALGAAIQLAGFGGALVVRSLYSGLESEPNDYVLQLPAICLIGLMHFLAVTLARYERAAHRERALARAGAALVACTDTAGVYVAALEGIRSLVSAYATVDDPDLLVRLQSRFAASQPGASGLPADSLLIRGDLGEMVLAVTPEPLPAECTDGLSALGSEVALALEAIGLRRAAEEQAVDMRTILDQLGDSLLVFDNDGTIQMANTAAGALLGMPHEHLVGLRSSEQPWSQLRPDGSLIPLAERAVTSVLHGAPSPGEYLLIGADGRRRWVWEQATLLRSGNGVVRGAVAVARETTERHRADEALRSSEERYRRIVETTQDGICQLDELGRIVYANQRLGALLAYPVEEMLGRAITDFLSADQGDQGGLQLAACLGHAANHFEARLARKDGQPVWVDGAVNAIFDSAATHTGMLAMLTDITERKQAEAALLHQAHHDPLTDLPNRTLFQDRLRQAIARADRDCQPLALLLLDLDRFKEVNDTFGHHTGDQLLQTVAGSLHRTLRTSDTVARLGGDEFAVIMNGADAQAAALMADRLGMTLQREQLMVAGHAMPIGVSVGIAMYPTHGDTAELLLQRADVAMYVAKRAGTGHAVYDSDQDRHSPERLALVHELRLAIDTDALVLHYQPKLDLRTGHVAGVEALVRWPHLQRGLLGPDTFVALAERTGLIRPLTNWVLDAAMRQSAAWQADGQFLPIAVNLSVADLQRAEFVQEVAALLDRYQLGHGAIQVEVTESTLMADPGRVAATLEALRAVGVAASIDDFGTGYSSLSYVKRLPVRELKIDQSFVSGLTSDDSDRAIVSATIDLAHALGLRTVAEGVEDARTLELLTELSCDEVQGYYFCRPLPAADFGAWMRLEQLSVRASISGLLATLR
jgi:diguanylate cyclase (GGDEF)-like protein/PAS domain S-box-containing protein